jgi:hypothetical protein
VKLFSQRKYPLAAKEFQKFIKDGTADVNTHAYLSYCLYNMRQYTQALQQFDWVSKYGTKSLTLKRSAEASATTLRNLMIGRCPNQCLKPDDPRWQIIPKLDPHKKWIRFSNPGGWEAISDGHMGQVVYSRGGHMVNDGVCPTCGGTGHVGILHNGDAVPQ